MGVQKAQISKIENSLTDAWFETIIKFFKALNAKIKFNVELLNHTGKSDNKRKKTYRQQPISIKQCDLLKFK